MSDYTPRSRAEIMIKSLTKKAKVKKRPITAQKFFRHLSINTVNEIRPSSDFQVTPFEDGTTSHAVKIIQQADNVLASENRTTTHVDKIVQEGDVIVAFENGTKTHADEIIQQVEVNLERETTIHDDEIMQQSDDVLTSKDGTINYAIKIIQEAEVVMFKDGTPAHDDKIIQQADDVLTSEDGAITHADEIIEQVKVNLEGETTIHDHEIMQQADDVLTLEDGTITHADEIIELVALENGTASHDVEIIQRADDFLALENGTTTLSDAIFQQADSVLELQDGTITHADGIIQDGTTTHDDEIIQQADDVLNDLNELQYCSVGNETTSSNTAVYKNSPFMKTTLKSTSKVGESSSTFDSDSDTPNKDKDSDADYNPDNDADCNPDRVAVSSESEELSDLQQRPIEGNNEHSTIRTTKKSKKILISKVFREEQKRKREMGRSYKGTKKNRITNNNADEDADKKWDYQIPRPSKNMKISCNCKQSLKSNSKLMCRKITENQRKEIYGNFWKNMNWETKRTYIASLMDSVETKFLWNRKIEPSSSRRTQTLKYHLNHNGVRFSVCKTMFLNTFDVTDWWVLQCGKTNKEAMLQAGEDSDTSEEEESSAVDVSARSLAAKKRHKKKMDALTNFLQSLNKMESHYCRQNTSKLYLEPIFQTKVEVYNLYKEEVGQQPDKPGLVALQTFYVEFDRLNLSIYVPRKDMCDKCVSYGAGNLSQAEFDEHQERKNLARQEKQKDNEGPNFVLTMDLQGVLLSPRMNASSLYYKMKLCVHNFTLFNNKNHNVTCYVWHEGEGGITSNEFATLITNFIREQELEDGQDVILWSDGAGYQNRNVNLSNSLLNLSQKLNINIIQKFLEVGHTQMECDSVHAQIERKLKNKTINIPADYVDIIKSARQKPCPYSVVYLDHTVFKDFSKLGPLKSIRPGTKVGDPCVNNIRALKYSRDGEIYYKLMFTDEWTPFQKRKSRHSYIGEVTNLFNGPLPIKPDKFEHLQQLKRVLCKDYHYFYDNLRH